MYFDSHAHLSAPPLLEEVSSLLQRAELARVHRIVTICTDTESLEQGLILHEKYPWVYVAAALPPHDIDSYCPSFFELLSQKAKEKKLVAIGETGLDYFYQNLDKKKQKEALSFHFSLAKETDLPVVFHCREAFLDLWEEADRQYQGREALVHCFTGNLEEAKGCLDRGWYLSFSGIVTFKKSSLLQEVASYVPLNRILLETDSPYLAPEKRRGQRNEPSFIGEIGEKIAALKGVSVEAVAEATSHNASSFYRLAPLS